MFLSSATIFYHDTAIGDGSERTPTETHTGADGCLGEEGRASLACYLLRQAAESHQTPIGSIKHVRGRHVAVGHTQSHGRVRHLWVQQQNRYVAV